MLRMIAYHDDDDHHDPERDREPSDHIVVKHGERTVAEIAAFLRPTNDDHAEDVQLRILDHNQEVLFSATVTKDGIVDCWYR